MTVAIKICGFTRPQDIDAAVELGADAIGLVLADDAHVPLNTQQLKELLARIPRERAKAVAVLGFATEEQAKAALELGFDWLQIVVKPEQSFSSVILNHVIPVYFDNPDVHSQVQSWSMAKPKQSSPFNCITIDGPAGGGKGISADHQRVAQIAKTYPIMLAGGLRANNVSKAIKMVQPVAVDVSSGVESAPGIKCVEKMGDFIKAVRSSDEP